MVCAEVPKRKRARSTSQRMRHCRCKTFKERDAGHADARPSSKRRRLAEGSHTSGTLHIFSECGFELGLIEMPTDESITQIFFLLSRTLGRIGPRVRAARVQRQAARGRAHPAVLCMRDHKSNLVLSTQVHGLACAYMACACDCLALACDTGLSHASCAGLCS